MEYLKVKITPPQSDIISCGDNRPFELTYENWAIKDTPRSQELVRIVKNFFKYYGFPMPVTFKYGSEEQGWTLGTFNKSKVSGQIRAGNLNAVFYKGYVVALLPVDDD